MTDTTQQETLKKVPIAAPPDAAGLGTETGDSERNIETSKERGFGSYDPRAFTYFDARLNRIEAALQQLAAAHAPAADQQQAVAQQGQQQGQPQGGQPAVPGQPQGGNGGNPQAAAAGAAQPPKPSPPANSTAAYVLASAHIAGLMWANPDLRKGALQFLPLAPAALSLLDDGLNKEGGKRAVFPALVGIGSVLAIGSVLK